MNAPLVPEPSSRDTTLIYSLLSKSLDSAAALAAVGQGRENAKQYLKENPLICEEIEAKVREMLNVDGTEESEETKENETEAQSIKAAEAIAKKAEAAEKKAENTAEVKAEE